MAKLSVRILELENSLCVAIDQINKNKNSPLTLYYCWPKTNAWEQLKNDLAFIHWINLNEKIKVLNEITQIINNWQRLIKKETK